MKRPSSAGEDVGQQGHLDQLNNHGSDSGSIGEGNASTLPSQTTLHNGEASPSPVRKVGSKYSIRNLFRKYSDAGDAGLSTTPLPTPSILSTRSVESLKVSVLSPAPTLDSDSSFPLPPSTPSEQPVISTLESETKSLSPPLPLLSELHATDTHVAAPILPHASPGHWNRTRKSSEVAVSSPLASESFVASPIVVDDGDYLQRQLQHRQEEQRRTMSLSPPLSPRSPTIANDGLGPGGIIPSPHRRISSQSARSLRHERTQPASPPPRPLRSVHRASSSASSVAETTPGQPMLVHDRQPNDHEFIIGGRQHDGIGEEPEVEDGVHLEGDAKARSRASIQRDFERQVLTVSQALGLVPGDAVRHRGDSLSSTSEGSANNAQSQSSLSTSSTADTMLTAPSFRTTGDLIASPESIGTMLKEEEGHPSRLVVSPEELCNVTSRADAEKLKRRAEEEILALAAEFTDASASRGGRKLSLAEQLEAYGQAVQLERRFAKGEAQKDVKINVIAADETETDFESPTSKRSIGTLGSPSRNHPAANYSAAAFSRPLIRASSLDHTRSSTSVPHHRSPSVGTFALSFDAPSHLQNRRNHHRPIANMSSLQHKRSLEASLVRRNAKDDLDYDDEDEVPSQEFGYLSSQPWFGGGDIEIIQTLPTPTDSPTSTSSTFRRSQSKDEPHSPASPTSPTGSTHSHYSRHVNRGYSEDSGYTSERIRSPTPLHHHHQHSYDPFSRVGSASTSRERASSGRNQTAPVVMGYADYAPVAPEHKGKRARLKDFVVQTLKGR